MASFITGLQAASDYIFGMIPEIAQTMLTFGPLTAVIALWIFRKLIDILNIIKG